MANVTAPELTIERADAALDAELNETLEALEDDFREAMWDATCRTLQLRGDRQHFDREDT